MPSGKAHLKIEAVILVLLLGLVTLLIVHSQIEWQQSLLFLGAYVFSMFLMSPDLDLSKSDAFHRWGLLRWLWFPYAWIFRHRQISHHLLFGPLSRILYMAILAFVPAWIYRMSTGNPSPRLMLSADVILPVFVGLYTPNIEHIAADWISTALRRKRRRRQL